MWKEAVVCIFEELFWYLPEVNVENQENPQS
jgi:hypothetical protein